MPLNTNQQKTLDKIRTLISDSPSTLPDGLEELTLNK